MLVKILNAPTAIRQTIAFGLTATIGLLGVWIGFAALSLITATRSDIDQKRELLGQLQAINVLANSLNQLSGPSGIEAASELEFLSGSSEAIIRGGLQTRLGDIAASNAVTVLSAANAPPLAEEGLTYVGLRASLSGSIEGIHASLVRLETSMPVLFLREATIRTASAGRLLRNNTPSELSAEIVFYGALEPASTADVVQP